MPVSPYENGVAEKKNPNIIGCKWIFKTKIYSLRTIVYLGKFICIGPRINIGIIC